MIDTHAHLNFAAFESDLEEVVGRAKQAQIETMIVVGAKLDSSEKAVQLAQSYPQLYATVGIHPHHAEMLSDNWLDIVTSLAQNPRVVAIGEIGLDYHTYPSGGIIEPAKQKRVLEAQLSLAKDCHLPVIIHCREAWEDLLPIVAQYKKHNGVFHCWSGTPNYAQTVLRMGFSIAFAGNLTYPTPKPPQSFRPLSEIQEVAKSIPLNRILLETDCPFLAPQPKRGLRNEPAFVTITANYLATLRSVSVKEIQVVTTQNAKRLFRLP